MRQRVRSNTIVVKRYNTAIQVRMPLGKKPVGSEMVKRGKRQAVKIFTFQSQRRARIHMDLYGHLYTHVIDLTYPGEWITRDARIEAGHLKRFLQVLERIGVIEYFWVKEYQVRGVLHFHVLVDRFIDKDLIRSKWSKIIGAVARTRIDVIRSKKGMAQYVVNYWTKEEQKTIPEGVTGHGRWWGSNRSIKPTEEVTMIYTDPDECRRLLRPVDKFYETKLKEWGKKTGKVYRRRCKRVGFTAFGLADAMSKIIYRTITYRGCPDVIV